MARAPLLRRKPDELATECDDGQLCVCVCVCVEIIVVDFISLRDMGGWELVIGVFHNHESERVGETERFDDEQM